MSFVDEGPTIRGLYRTDKGERLVDSSAASPSATSSGSRPISSTPFERLSWGTPGESGAASAARGNGQSQDLERSTLVSILSPSAYQSQLLSLFLATVRLDSSVQVLPTFSCHSIWLAKLAGRVEVSPTLLYAIRAMCLSFLGHQTRDENLVQNSRLIYGRTLLKLNKAIQDPEEGLASDTLSATVLLTFYEMLNCTENCSWIRHAGGAARLMQVRGVARYQTDFDRAMFVACRYAIVLESFQTGTRCFLSSPPWRRLSRKICDSSPNKSAYEEAREDFFQEVVQHPGYNMDAVAYMAGGGRDRSVLQDLVRRGHTHRSNHQANYDRLMETLREAGHEPREVPSSVDDKVFPIIYHYPGIIVASTVCSYWSLLKILNIALIGLEARLSALNSTFQDLQEEITPVQMLKARNMKLSRENITNIIVAESEAAGDVESATPRESNMSGSGDANQYLPNLTVSRPTSTRCSGTPLPAASSPMEYPTMSPSDTAKRREMYMAENRHSARQICKSVENVCTSAFLGPMFLIFSLRVIARMLDSSEEKGWVLRKLEGLGRTWGVARENADQMEPVLRNMSLNE